MIPCERAIANAVISRYTTYFSIISLVYFVLNNLNEPGTQEILADANAGKAALNGLAMRSQAADRCSISLKVNTTYSSPMISD